MAKVTRRTRKVRPPTRRRVRSRVPKSIPIVAPTTAALRLADEVDLQLGKPKFNDRRIAPHRSRVMKGMAHDYKGSLAIAVKDMGAVAFAWPDGMYVPRDKSSGVPFPRPPADHLYTHDWTDGRGISKADKYPGTLFAWSGVRTTEPGQIGEAGVGITYSPKNALSYIRFEPEVNCSVTYRAFVDFWPMLIAGTVRARASIIMAAWLLTSIGTSESFELLHPWREVLVFDTGNRDAASDLSPDIHAINTFQKNFSWSDLGTTFLLQGGRKYLLGAIARVEVRHSVTTNTGKVISHDGSRFKLYSYMACNVPDMFVSVQRVLLP